METSVANAVSTALGIAVNASHTRLLSAKRRSGLFEAQFVRIERGECEVGSNLSTQPSDTLDHIAAKTCAIAMPEPTGRLSQTDKSSMVNYT
jgi:hypothetical protein